MVKIKQSKSGSFKITGLNISALEAIATLVNHTRLGDGVYESVAFELVEAFDEFHSDFFTLDDCTLTVDTEQGTPTINLVSVYD